MAERIINMRTLLRQNLEDLNNPLPWKHVTEQIGMFCFSGISPEQVRPPGNLFISRHWSVHVAPVRFTRLRQEAAALEVRHQADLQFLLRGHVS